MRITLRVLLGILFAETLLVGGWNAVAPESFYREVPTVDLTPPFSEHYARDFGWSMLGIALLLGIALYTLDARHMVPAGLAYTVFAVPHFFFHLTHLGHATTGQAVLLTAGNAVIALMALALVALALVQGRKDRTRAPG